MNSKKTQISSEQIRNLIKDMDEKFNKELYKMKNNQS